MSIKLMTRVYEHECSHPEQSVLLAMADHADDDGRGCFPSVALVAWKTGYTERNVQRVISQLRERGALELVQAASRYRPNEYRIDLSVLPEKPAFDPGQGRQSVTPARTARGDVAVASGVTDCAVRGDNSDTRGDTTVVSGVTPVSPEPTTEPSRNHQGNLARAAADDDAFDDALEPVLAGVFGFDTRTRLAQPEPWTLDALDRLRTHFSGDVDAARRFLEGLPASEGWRYRYRTPERTVPWLVSVLADARLVPKPSRPGAHEPGKRHVPVDDRKRRASLLVLRLAREGDEEAAAALVTGDVTPWMDKVGEVSNG